MSIHRAVQVSLTLAVCLMPAALPADDSQGKAAYLRYCSACHGPGGKGDGVVAHLMTPKPTDLTTIAKQNKGEFSADQVAKTIDGRTTFRAHGEPNMPVWGEILDEEAAEAGEPPAQIRKKVRLITEYLKSTQVK